MDSDSSKRFMREDSMISYMSEMDSEKKSNRYKEIPEEKEAGGEDLLEIPKEEQNESDKDEELEGKQGEKDSQNTEKGIMSEAGE
jgi:hypothetical protein